MFNTYLLIDGSSVPVYIFSKIYIYAFVALFIYVVLSVFISLIEDTYRILHVSWWVYCVSNCTNLKCSQEKSMNTPGRLTHEGFLHDFVRGGIALPSQLEGKLKHTLLQLGNLVSDIVGRA